MAFAVQDKPRAVIVISSHVVRGTVGNRAMVFALETLGFPVWAVPTVTLPWHPGHGKATRIVPQAKEFAAMMKDLEGARWLGEVSAVISGYLAEAEQAAAVASLVHAVKKKNPAALYLCDPVIGDQGGLYVAEDIAAAQRDRLLPLADIATPNRYELEWLTGAKLDTPDAVADAALDASPPTMLVTSAPSFMARGTGNILVTPDTAMMAEHRHIDNPPNGPGDLTGAVFLARLLDGQDLQTALQLTTESVFEILARTAKRGADELTLETDAQSLSHPMAMVQTRSLAFPGGGRRA
ncbi:pyridoxal kinase PdxY [Mesorhizobium sp. Z1-4]|uniref:pyridoxal kinase PdxY n=1 Tax=Mesorhizobium sp. Z1-4 TaxID=2448478 RepID=UPI000FD7551B|nr:pyridoxal kinase PdxY [Mesorhizobium sp. Z1-4]